MRHHALVRKIREQLNGAVVEARSSGAAPIRIEAARLVGSAIFSNARRDFFQLFADLTWVHLPDRGEAHFEMVYNLYSISTNERVRLKSRPLTARASNGFRRVAHRQLDGARSNLISSACSSQPSGLRRIAAAGLGGPPDQEDYPLEFIDNEWTARHLPQFTVQREQLEPRRGYGWNSSRRLTSAAPAIFQQGRK